MTDAHPRATDMTSCALTPRSLPTRAGTPLSMTRSRRSSRTLSPPLAVAPSKYRYFPLSPSSPVNPSAGRAQATLKSSPAGAKNAIAVLSASGVDFQDNAADARAYQYWADIDAGGAVSIPRVKAGTYRLTVYADGTQFSPPLSLFSYLY